MKQHRCAYSKFPGLHLPTFTKTLHISTSTCSLDSRVALARKMTGAKLQLPHILGKPQIIKLDSIHKLTRSLRQDKIYLPIYIQTDGFCLYVKQKSLRYRRLILRYQRAAASLPHSLHATQLWQPNHKSLGLVVPLKYTV